MSEAVIGRDNELESIEAFVDSARGGPAALLIEGEAGIGKTTLWEAAVDEGRKRGFEVLVAAPAETEGALSFAALADLLEPVLPAALEGLPDPQERALRVALLLADAEGPPPEPRAIAAALRGALLFLANEQPVLVAIDDVQWLDPSSAAALAFVARRLRDEPIGFLLAQRPGHRSGAFAIDRTGRIELGPLSLGALRRLLEERLGRSYSRLVLRRLHEVSGGNPFYAIELARVLEPEQQVRPDESLPVPARLGELLLQRVRALPEATVETLHAAAALAHPTTDVLTKALGAEARSLLQPAVEAGVVSVERGRVRFAHPLVAETLRGTQSDAEERILHRRLADAVADREARARHLARAAETPDETVAETLEDAAATASARGAPTAAAELAEESLRLSPELVDVLHRRTLVAAEYHFLSGETQRARELLEELIAEEPPGHRRAVALERLAKVVDRPGASIPMLEQARREAGNDVRLMIMIDRRLAGQACVAWKDLPRAAGHLRGALALAETLGDPAVLAQALAAAVWTETFLGNGLDRNAIERAVRIGAGAHDEIPLANDPRWVKAVVLDFVDDVGESRALLEQLCEEAGARGDEPALATFLNQLSWLEWRVGAWAAAVRHAEEADELSDLADFETVRAYTLAQRTWVYAYLGRIDEARAVAERGLRQADRLEALLPRYDIRHALGVLALSLGDVDEARRQLAPLVEGIRGAGVREPGFMRSLPDEVEALTALGKKEEAAELITPFERDAERLDRAWALATASRCRGLVAAAEGDLEVASDRFRESLRYHDRVPEPFERARTLLAFGVVQRRGKQRRAARETLESALAIFAQLGAALWAERARAELRRIGGRAPSAGELTPMERRVAELVAAGRSNREIAAELSVTLRTVETHLSRIYRKLGVRSRTQLASRITKETVIEK